MSIRVGIFRIVWREGNLWMKHRVRREGLPDNLWITGRHMGENSLLAGRKQSADLVWINRYIYPQMLITLCISGGFHGG
jgi:hypothetical protein